MSRFRFPVSTFATCTNMALVAATMLALFGMWHITRTHDLVLASETQNARNLARSLAQHAARTFEGADLILATALDRVKNGIARDHFKADLEQLVDRATQVSNLVVTDATGAWITDAVPPHAPLSSADRDYFLEHRDHRDRALFIGDKVSGRYGLAAIIPLARRIDNPDGSFGGVVVAALKPDYLQAFYQTVHIGKHGSISLYNTNGHVLVRFPGAAADANRDAARVALSAKDFEPPTGVSRMPARLDGIERIFAFEHVDGFPLVVSAGVAVDDALASWRSESLTEAIAITLAGLGFVFLGIAADRHRRKALDLARASEEINRRYRLLAEHSSDIVALKPSFAGPRAYVSPSVFATLGFEEAEFNAQSAVDSVHPDDLERVAALFATLTVDLPRVTSLHRLRHKAGHYVWVETIFHLTHAGTPDECVIATARDITARRLSDEAVKESEERYRILAHASTDLVCRIDLNGRQRYASPATFEMLGYQPDEMVDRSHLTFVHPDDSEKVGAVIEGLARGRNEQSHCVHRVRHKEGHYIWVDARFRLVLDEQTGAPSEIVSSLRDVTEREMLQRQVEETNRRLLMAEEIAHVGHWRVDLQTNDLTWSEEVFRIHGYDPTSYVPSVAAAIATYHPEDQPLVTRLVNEAIAHHKSYQFKCRIVRPNGEVRHVLSRGFCKADDATGSVSGIFGTIMDVTDLSEVERRLRRESSLLTTTLNTMDQGLVKVAPDGTVVLANRRFLELLDLPGELFDAPLPHLAAIVAHLRSAGESWAHEPIAADGSTTEEFLPLGTREHHRPSGTILEIRTVQVPSGATVSTFADITARRRAEIATEESESRYRILADTTSDVITQLDLKFQHTYVSPACRRVLGYTPDEMIGTQISASMHPDDIDAVVPLATRLIAGEIDGDRTVATYRARHKIGHWVWLEAGMNVVRDGATGSPNSLICCLRDVTERQKIAHHLERARTIAEEAVTAKAAFVANMSHELRTPLTGMLGVHDLLRRDPHLSDAQKRLVGLASESGRSLLNIVNDILDFSKIEAGQLTLESVPFDLRGLVETCQALASEGMNGKRVAITTRFEPVEPGWFVGDPSRLQQVLLNLLTNAVKFTERGMIGIGVSFERKTSILRVEVRDTGIGIPAEKLPLLFERFSQADASVTRRFGGTGLGLSISKHLVELMKGSIGVESHEGEGSCFWFELPMPQHVGAQGETVSVEDTHLQGCRILLAEDNLINQEIIGAMLRNQGHRVVMVPDGSAAIKALQTGRLFDLVLMDLQMPVMDGMTATSVIRRLEQAEGGRRVPIIGLTANAMSDDVIRCLDAGMDGHVAKPIDWSVLFAAIERVTAVTDADPLQVAQCRAAL